MHYRAEIDGLRAVAILPVLFFHANFTFLAGGFLGVDVFFVISGYLITSILLKDLANNRFSIAKFYERRARRILPALSLVVFISLFVGVLTLPANALRDLSQSIVGVAAFSSNFYFFLTNDYFATAAEELMMIHTWSLAVEEQFYIVFPIMLAALYKYRLNLTPTMIIIMLLSFLSSLWICGLSVSANFYLPISRAWELLAGALIAVHYKRLNQTKLIFKNLLSLIGLVLLMLCYLYFDKSITHPGPMTVIPILATVLIIAYAEGSFVSKCLTIKPLIGIGLISYSLYLWHQPILALIRIKSIEEPSQLYYLLGIGCATLMAIFSWRYVERPFRQANKLSRPFIVKFSVFSLLAMFTLGALGHFNQGWENRFARDIVKLLDYKVSPVRYQCHTSGTDYIAPKDACILNSHISGIAIFGDSHSVELAKALSVNLPDIGVIQLSFGACSPSSNHNLNIKGCNSWMREAVNYLKEQKSIHKIIIAYRHRAYLGRDDLSAADAQYWTNFKSVLDELSDAGKVIYVISPIPSLPMHIDKLVTPLSIFSEGSRFNLTKLYPLTHYLNANHFIRDKLANNQTSNIHFVDVADIFCDSIWCSAIKNHKSLYFDDNHLSMFGASLVADRVVHQFSTPKMILVD